MNARLAMVVLAITSVLGLGCPACGPVFPADPLPGLRPTTTTWTLDPTRAQAPVSADAGVGLYLPANSLQASDGSAPTGAVTLAIESHVDRRDRKPSDMPGSFTGVGSDGKTYALISLGVIGVNLTDSTGRPLNLKSGQTATVLVRLMDPNLIHLPPASMPLWNLPDEATVWREEGTADLIVLEPPEGDGTHWYRGVVSHFSMWNVDWKCNNACITIVLHDEAGRPLAGAGVFVKSWPSDCGWSSYGVNSLSGGAGTTDANGRVTIRGVANGSAEVWAIRGTQKATVTLEIPASGDSCVDGGVLAFRCEPERGCGTDCCSADQKCVSGACVSEPDPVVPPPGPAGTRFSCRSGSTCVDYFVKDASKVPGMKAQCAVVLSGNCAQAGITGPNSCAHENTSTGDKTCTYYMTGSVGSCTGTGGTSGCTAP